MLIRFVTLKKIVFIFLLGLLLCSCVNLGPNQRANNGAYQLNQLPPSTPSRSSNGLTVLVTEPKADPGYASARMMYVTQAYQLKEFSKHQWIEPPAHMLLPLIVQSLQNTGRFKAITSSLSYPSNADVRLDTDILNLQQEFFNHPSQIHIRLRAQLINMHTQRVIATRQFETIENTPQDTPYGGVIAANQAMSRLLAELNRFCVLNARL